MWAGMYLDQKQEIAMNKYMIIIGLSLFSFFLRADHKGLEIEKIEKVVINKGLSLDQIKDMIFDKMACLLCLKKHKTMEEALASKKAEIEKCCTEFGLTDKECKHLKKKVAKHIWQCFTGKHFFKEFMMPAFMDAEPTAPAAPVDNAQK